MPTRTHTWTYDERRREGICQHCGTVKRRCPSPSPGIFATEYDVLQADGTYQRVTGPAPVCDPTVMDADRSRIRNLVLDKLAAEQPEHPWVLARERARANDSA